MSGCLYFDGPDVPAVGMQVLVLVDSANSPTGLWWGELTEIIREPQEVLVNRDLRGDHWIGARVQLIDERLRTFEHGDAYFGRAPGVNYTVFPVPAVAAGTIRMLLERIGEQKQEINGLKRRRDAEVNLLKELFGAMARTDANAVKAIEKIATALHR